MAAAAAGGDAEEEKQQQSSSSSTFERLHGELVREAGELAASCGADVTVLAVPPRAPPPSPAAASPASSAAVAAPPRCPDRRRSRAWVPMRSSRSTSGCDRLGSS
uniref:MADS-box domain-containing protein n=1 Tax=Oryza barthii TaxID=65489 RepID=A0A0D3GWT8_9ORYZ